MEVRSMKNLFIAAGVLLAVLLGVYFIIRPKPPAPEIQRLADLTDLAERTCLSNTTDSNSLGLKVQLDAMKKIDGKASIEQQHSAARGAAQAFTGELQKQENTEIRACMDPWSKQIRDLAAKL